MLRRRERRAFGVVACLVLGGGLAGCPSPERDDDLLTSGKKLYSQFDEELIIRHFFADRRNGFFVDVGCYDWKEDSTTLYLEKHLGWSGIGIDANDRHAAGYAEHRPNTRFLNYLVTNESGGEETFYLAVGVEAISSAAEQWIYDFYRAFRVDSEPKVREVTVPTITLNDLLEQHGVSRIDFLSMDIEGHEPEALAGFDIERFRPALVCIEAGNREEIVAYFEEHGYERIEKYLEYDKVNWYFKPTSGDAP